MIIKKLIKGESIIKPPISQKIKSGLVFLKKGEAVGKHITDNKEEIIIILQGKATVIVENEKKVVDKDSIVYIPDHKNHNVINNHDEELKYIYVVGLI